jgi:hypothetical protein
VSDISSATPATHPNISVDHLELNSLIKSPLTVTGKAKGWYFEGSFPIEIVDSNGSLIAQMPASAQDDWMTSEFVAFKAILSWNKTPNTPTGTIIFKKDNPSGLPEHDDSFSIPIRFK